jgi:hypothetical protein
MIRHPAPRCEGHDQSKRKDGNTVTKPISEASLPILWLKKTIQIECQLQQHPILRIAESPSGNLLNLLKTISNRVVMDIQFLAHLPLISKMLEI